MAIRMPYTGDFVEEGIIVGVTARSAGGGLAIVTVWAGSCSGEGSTLHVFQQFQTATLEEARQARDAIAEAAGLDKGRGVPGTPDDDGAGGGEEEGDPAPGADPAKAGKKASARINPEQALAYLKTWQPSSPRQPN